MKRPVWKSIVLTVILSIAGAGTAFAQIPDKFTNLKVFPETVDRRQLVDAMKGFSFALGVRCNHCHVGENPDSLEGYDFASDEKESKRIARAMMTMTREINEKLLPTIGRASTVDVRCITCHRGLDRPRTLDTILLETMKEKGAEETIALYRDMHTKYEDQGVFDFSARTLDSVAESLAQDRDLTGAITLMTFNAEEHPEDANLQLMLGGFYRAKGDREAAIACFEKALTLNPDSGWAKKQLQALKQEAAKESE